MQGNGIINGTYIKEFGKENGSFILSKKCNSSASGKFDNTLTFLDTNDHDDLLDSSILEKSTISIDDEDFRETIYDSIIMDYDPDEDIEKKTEYKSSSSGIYIYVSDEDMDDEDMDDEDMDDEDMDDEDMDDEDSGWMEDMG